MRPWSHAGEPQFAPTLAPWHYQGTTESTEVTEGFSTEVTENSEYDFRLPDFQLWFPGTKSSYRTLTVH